MQWVEIVPFHFYSFCHLYLLDVFRLLISLGIYVYQLLSESIICLLDKIFTNEQKEEENLFPGHSTVTSNTATSIDKHKLIEQFRQYESLNLLEGASNNNN